MHIIYSSAPSERGAIQAYDKQDANKHYNVHYVNSRVLRNIINDPKEPRERRVGV